MMKSAFKVLLLACGLAQAHDVSRKGKHIEFVLQVSAVGDTTPMFERSYAKHAKENPKIPDHLTTLGQRQNYLVGWELRKRYVEEAKFLSADYDISQMWIQSTFDQNSIISAQAMLTGMYPPGTNKNLLTKWQQKNAVPPNKDGNYTKWQEELGANALKDGFNVFPINMNGHENDFMLMLGQNNCPSFRKVLGSKTQDIAHIHKKFRHFFKHLAKQTQEKNVGVEEALLICQYVDWADINQVKLKFKAGHHEVHECHKLMGALNKLQLESSKELGHLGAADFVTYMKHHVLSVAKQMDYKDTLHYKMHGNKKTHGSLDEKHPNNAHKQPNYVLFVTQKINLQMILNALQPKLGHGVIPSTSMLILEMVRVNGQQYVEMFYNDEPLKVQSCKAHTRCTVAEFTSFLSKISSVASAEKACAEGKSQKDVQITQ